MKPIADSGRPQLNSIPRYPAGGQTAVTSNNFRLVYLKALQQRTGVDLSSEINNAESREAEKRKSAEDELQNRLFRLQPIRQDFIKSLEKRPGLKDSMHLISSDSLRSAKAERAAPEPVMFFKGAAPTENRAADVQPKLVPQQTQLMSQPSASSKSPGELRPRFKTIVDLCAVIEASSNKEETDKAVKELLAKENRRPLSLLHRDDDRMLDAFKGLKSKKLEERKQAANYIRRFLTDPQHSVFKMNRNYIYK